MLAFALILSTLSLLLLAAHYLRQGNWTLCLGFLVVAGLLLFRRRRVHLRVTQVLLGFGAVIWGLTIAESVRARLAEHGDPRRLVAILGAVVVVDVAAVVLLGTRRVTERYAGRASGESPR